ncbi:MAG: RagB/SusD family nutrient uptake outer membrane protein [Bacteroidales bacterium]|nr:RagB/SusD family nutrient uptake outer membrane protein [Bacteroidales bacterium]
MKKFAIIGLGLSLCMMTGCLNDGFLDVSPKDQQSEETVFTTGDNFKTYAWALYGTFTGYGNNDQSKSYFSGDYNADNLIWGQDGSQGQFAYQRAITNTTDENWNYSYIRRVNLMLDHIDDSEMNDTEKEHWRSVGYLFRSFKYFQMLSRFGEIPWVEHVLTDESEELYAPRDSRDLVAGNILANLQYAEEHIGDDPEIDGANTINRYVVEAVLSRFGLFEGTWRKYHGLSGAETYLMASAEASEKLIAAFPTLHPRYEEIFNSEDLSGMDGIILYKKYEAAQLMHGFTRMVRTGESYLEVTKDAVDSYLCSNGLPIANQQSGYLGDRNMYDQFTDRDYRLYHTACPPYMVNLIGSSSSAMDYTLTDDPQDSKFIDLMASISGETYHRLPTSNFKGYYNKAQPHFRDFNRGHAWNSTYMGFFMWKYYNTHTDCNNANGCNTTDAPIFRMGEILCNYAEALCELNGTLTQDQADRSINKLRDRANVAHMIVGEIGPDFDPDRDPDVEPLLWEIRRERRVELMGESFRLDDLRRWKKGEYVNKQPVGIYVDPRADYASALKVTADGYAYFFGVPPGWLDKYYLFSIPTNQIALNPALEQNPGWE